LITEIKRNIPDVNQNTIYKIIKDNNMKLDPQYSAYNFRTKEQEDRARETGKIPTGVTSIYNENAVNYLIRVLKGK